MKKDAKRKNVKSKEIVVLKPDVQGVYHLHSFKELDELMKGHREKCHVCED
jgi:hypothetical protein